MAFIISVRGLLCWSVVMIPITYFGGVALLAHWFSQKPFNHITYTDLVSPSGWQRYHELRSHADFDHARYALKNRNFRSAFASFRSGLARHPEDTQARLELAASLIQYRLRPEAEKVLFHAFDYAYPGRVFIEEASGLIESGDNPGTLLAFCNRALAAIPAEAPHDRRYVDSIKIKALINLGRDDDAVELVQREYSAELSFISSVTISRALARHDHDTAITLLKTWQARSAEDEQFLTAAVQVYCAAGKYSEMQAVLLRLLSLYPSNPDNVALGITANLQGGHTQDALNLIDSGVPRFSDQPAVLSRWAESIGKTDHDEALRYLERSVLAANRDPQDVILTLLMTQIRRQAWADAQATSTRIDALYPKLAGRLNSLHRIAKALIATCTQPTSGAGNTLTSCLTDDFIDIDLYRQITNSLVNAERIDAALEILTLAEGYYPNSSYIAKKRAELAPKLAAIKAVRSNAATRSVAPQDIPSNAAGLIAQLDASSSEDALRLIGRVRKADPVWMKDNRQAIEWRAILLAAQTGDLGLLQLDLENYLRTKSKANLEQVIGQAHKWRSENRNDAALLAIRKVLDARPGHVMALSLLAEWAPAQSSLNLEHNATASSSREAHASNPDIPASSEILFKTIDSYAANTRFTEALQLIRITRRAGPDWLGAALPELEWREIMLAGLADDLPLLQLNLRTHLRAHPIAKSRCLEQAITWQAEDKTSIALVVVREVLRQTPDDPAALKLLARWNTK